MRLKRGKRHILPALRDFVCALALFIALFGVLSLDRTYIFQLPVLPLFSATETATSVSSNFRAWGDVGHYVVAPQPISPALTMIFLAVAFAGIVAVNLAILRHLRRVHASSRRGVWRGS